MICYIVIFASEECLIMDKKEEIRCFWCGKLLEVKETKGNEITQTKVGVCTCPGSGRGANKVAKDIASVVA